MTDKRTSESSKPKRKSRKIPVRAKAVSRKVIAPIAPKPVKCRLVNRKNSLTVATILTSGGVVELRLGPHASSDELELSQITPHSRRLIDAGYLSETTA